MTQLCAKSVSSTFHDDKVDLGARLWCWYCSHWCFKPANASFIFSVLCRPCKSLYFWWAVRYEGLIEDTDFTLKVHSLCMFFWHRCDPVGWIGPCGGCFWSTAWMFELSKTHRHFHNWTWFFISNDWLSCLTLNTDCFLLSSRKIRLRWEVAEARRRAVGVHGRGGHQGPPETRLSGSITPTKARSPKQLRQTAPSPLDLLLLLLPHRSTCHSFLLPPHSPKLFTSWICPVPWLFWRGRTQVSTPRPPSLFILRKITTKRKRLENLRRGLFKDTSGGGEGLYH